MPKAKVNIVYASRYTQCGALVLEARPDHAIIAQIEKILEDVCYRDWEWYLIITGDEITLASSFNVEDTTTHRPVRLMFFAGALVVTGLYRWAHVPLENLVLDHAWRAVKEFALHEAAEWFLYKGAMIHDPHKDERATHELEKKYTDSIKTLHSGKW